MEDERTLLNKYYHNLSRHQVDSRKFGLPNASLPLLQRELVREH
ncbi:hypothetical protein lpg0579 [Legionella pneumophila subsp. pneumophila str. Philadelphia 1]|uniref:Uncharacterized protein n=1 Tax=Legionella pneumophila subsp. pneumophila (strain Philadelphia 1 / ATCC 33152 / DSM 7513) TaxID=272624 RepID=Q5ZY01_LEGPH|nr:hypothetical protein lpg0579 [Legionella pneumophila subsp. pneumophila str. Philadelphia 1]AEW50855.1 hypothetical protein lp12_0584 [Legionella pneumophila subsp. pneumophila ATCC 43290]